MRHPIVNPADRNMKRTVLSIATAAVFAAQPQAHAVLGVGDIVSDPIAEEALIQKNIFDQIKYAWEQTQWADKLATLHNTLTTVREHLETANLIKQAIGDPVAAIALIDNGLFSDFLQDSDITDTLTDLAGIAQEGVELSATIQELFGRSTSRPGVTCRVGRLPPSRGPPPSATPGSIEAIPRR